MSQFIHHPLRLLNPTFDSPLFDVLNDLEYLRRLQLRGTTPAAVFMQLKHLFHILESLASARIEGNHTTLADLVDAKIEQGEKSDGLLEIENIEQAMCQVEDSLEAGAPLSEHLLRGLHATTVNELAREGDKTPGAYRLGAVQIAKSDHLPPDSMQVPQYMAELIDFINKEDPPKYDLMKVALAHHRFAWVHPFGNGNGRVVRLLTYALLIKYGFKVNLGGRLLNPAAVFCADREKYYAMLSAADTGTDQGLEDWVTYVLTGVRDELKKVDRLANYEYLKSKILLPAVVYARGRDMVTEQEGAVLNATIKNGVIKAGDLAHIAPKPNQRTYLVGKLVESGMLQPTAMGARQYTLAFSHNRLLRCVIKTLSDEGFITDALAGPAVPAAAL